MGELLAQLIVSRIKGNTRMTVGEALEIERRLPHFVMDEYTRWCLASDVKKPLLRYHGLPDNATKAHGPRAEKLIDLIKKYDL
jgi:hypothetical protein